MPDQHKSQHKAYLFALLTVGLWSTIATALKLSLAHLSPPQLVFTASLFSTLVLALLLIARGKLGRAMRAPASDWKKAFLLGLLNPCGYYFVLFRAYDLLPAQEAQALNYTWAITLALLSIPLLKQRIRGREILATFICYFGVLVIATHGAPLSLNFNNPVGVAYALGSSIFWALYWIANTGGRRDPVTALFQNFLCGLVPAGLLAALFGGPLPPADGLIAGAAGAAYVGFFEMGLTFVFWLSALRLSENTARVSMIAFLSPFLSLFFISTILGEPILTSTYVGLCFIVGGLIFQKTGERQP